MIWLSVDDRPPRGLGSRFFLARDLRMALRAEELPASLFSIYRDLPELITDPAADVVFPIDETHPAFPGDPVGLRRALERDDVCYTGSIADAAALAYDKGRARQAMADAGVVVPLGISLATPADIEPLIASFRQRHDGPMVAKPTHGPGGSYGVTLLPTLDDAMRYLHAPERTWRHPLLIEEFVNGREITVWVLGIGDDLDTSTTFVLDKQGRAILDHDLKERIGGKHQLASECEDLSTTDLSTVQEAARQAHRALGCYSYSRVDAILRDGQAVVLEVNAQPTIPSSGRVMLNAGTGKTLGEVVQTFVEHAHLRHRERRVATAPVMSVPASTAPEVLAAGRDRPDR